MNLSSSLEDYLEAIYDVEVTGDPARVTDISTKLKVEKSSVNYAVKKLKNLNLVHHERYTDIRLTARGKREAKRIKRRHDGIKTFLKDYLRLSSLQAEKDACKMEHVISNETFERLLLFSEFLETNTLADKDRFLKCFDAYIEGEKSCKEEEQ